MTRTIYLIFLIAFSGCVGVPDGIRPVDNFEVNRYLGKWYEVARLDHSFERGLSNVSANYSLRKDGNLKVINRGFNQKKNKWSEAEGKAKFVKTPDIGELKVSFFGPFYGAYNIIDLDKNNYDWAMITGNDLNYLWILSRTPEMKPERLKQLIDKAKRLKFATEKLIFVDQKLNQ
jgi:apolipoprotein D and lipocalin family protein